MGSSVGSDSNNFTSTQSPSSFCIVAVLQAITASIGSFDVRLRRSDAAVEKERGFDPSGQAHFAISSNFVMSCYGTTTTGAYVSDALCGYWGF